MMTWFKLYHDLPDHINLRKFSAQEKWAWVALLCLASKNKARGEISARDEDIADYCEFQTTQDWLYYRDKLIAKGMIEINGNGNIQILSWEERQAKKPSDQPEAIRVRVAKHRAGKKQKAVTPSNALQGVSNADVTRQIENKNKELDQDLDLKNKISPDHEPEVSTTDHGGDKSPKGGKGKKSGKTKPCEYTPGFEAWWKVYYGFCQSISTDEKLVSAGSKKEAFGSWQKLFPDDCPSADFLEGDSYYRQIKTNEFRQKGAADFLAISHGCRYLGAADEDPKWKQALDFKRLKEAKPGDAPIVQPDVAAKFEELRRVAEKHGHKVEPFPEMQGRFLLNRKIQLLDLRVMNELIQMWETPVKEYQ